ncbi:MAG: PRC-barrel domain-containing protein [Rhodospirillales bacterium]|nr:PRC-barrel domain-containing protein [Rhodospirillales bacterium]
MKLPLLVLPLSMATLLSTHALADAQQSADRQSAERPSTFAAAGSTSTDRGAAAKTLHVTAARSLVGDQLRDQGGKDLGTIRYLLIGVNDARIRYAVVAPSEGSNDQLVPVPWTALSTDNIGDNALTTDRQTFSKQKKYKQDQIAELTQPSVITQIYEVWAPVSQGAGGKASRQQGSEQGKAQQQTTAQGDQQKAPKQGAQQQGDQGAPHFLVGRDVVATVLPPVFRATDDLRGSEVYSSDNKDFAEIDNLMIDLDHGRLAYVQISQRRLSRPWRGDYAGPFGALTYDQARNGYQVSKSEDEIEKMQHFSRGQDRSTVSEADLNKLYQNFGVEPYWQHKT